MKEIINKNLCRILYFIVFFVIICVVYFFNQYYITFADDTNELFMYNYAYHGKYFVSMMLHFCVGMPHLLFENMHPITWIQTGGSIIKGILLTILLYQIVSFTCIRNNKSLLFSILVLFDFILYYLYIYDNAHFLYECTFFYYCIFCFCFFFFFWNYFIKLCIFQKKTKRDIYVLCLFSFMIGISSDVVALVSFFALILLLIFIKKINNKIKRRDIFFIFSSLFIASIFTYLNINFIERVNQYDICKNLVDSFFVVFSDFIVFNILNLQIILSKFCFYILTIVFIYILTCFLYKKNKISKSYRFALYLVPILFLSIILFCYLLLFLKCNYASNCLFHNDIIFQIKILLIMIIHFQVGILNINNKKISYILVIFFISLFLSKNLPLIKKSIEDINKYGVYNYVLNIQATELQKENYRTRYILERISLWYCYMKKTPIIYGHYDVIDKFYMMINDEGKIMSTISIYLSFSGIYKNINYDTEIIYVPTMEEVIEKYYENGGREITDAEIKEADFNKLLDKDWVLYGDKQ